MSVAGLPPQVIPRVQAHALADELGRRGFIAAVLRTRGHQLHPCVHIAGRRGWHRAEYIYAAPDQDRWQFWWSCLYPIAPVSDITATAETITRVLTPARAAVRLARTALPQPVMVPVLAVPAGNPGSRTRPAQKRSAMPADTITPPVQAAVALARTLRRRGLVAAGSAGLDGTARVLVFSRSTARLAGRPTSPPRTARCGSPGRANRRAPPMTSETPPTPSPVR